MLAQMPDRQAGRPDHGPLVGFFAPKQNTEQSRFSGTIPPDQPDVLAGVVLPGDATQHVVGTVDLMDVVEAVEHVWS